ncbi:hypothetical protein [Kitasatospora phosalacinea]|uniref:hypothetical protein n=1 Tax=Kitasatospora phosalacinea TaxID=2065 RepID=UPI0005257C20|nr:hypothetical protein [Kitasatospora phosalacinea]
MTDPPATAAAHFALRLQPLTGPGLASTAWCPPPLPRRDARRRPGPPPANAVRTVRTVPALFP